MPRFSLSGLLWSVSSIAVAFSFVYWGLAGYNSPQRALAFLSLPFLGAGLGSLYQRKKDGFLWGGIAAEIMILAALLLSPMQYAR